VDSFEWNKVFMAVLSAALVIMGISSLTPALYDDGTHSDGHGDEVELAFKVEIAEAVVEAEEEEEGPSLAMLLASASAEKGERQFGKCRACHNMDKGGSNGVGPNLYGVVGGPVAGRDGYKYSAALSAHGGNWTFDRLDAWLANPKLAVKGNKMSFAGLRRPDQRADLILYLRSFSDAPIDLPAVEAAVEEAIDAVTDAADDVVGEVADDIVDGTVQ